MFQRRLSNGERSYYRWGCLFKSSVSSPMNELEDRYLLLQRRSSSIKEDATAAGFWGAIRIRSVSNRKQRDTTQEKHCTIFNFLSNQKVVTPGAISRIRTIFQHTHVRKRERITIPVSKKIKIRIPHLQNQSNGRSKILKWTNPACDCKILEYNSFAPTVFYEFVLFPILSAISKFFDRLPELEDFPSQEVLSKEVELKAL
ncbi:hypothetical protein CEXT_17881 [Caerostris extrusa]|uniref:Ribosomal protein S10 n=1 Tax=Caerostris extrusa TaxID=172846 RepID=A0AAV4P319_CAEEX|nr:hypothetical protein CEXT_17881 [Caerostris extrusa]